MLYALIKILALPPGSQAALGVLGLLLYRRWRRLGLGLLGAAAISLWILAMPLTGALAARLLETIPPLDLARIKGGPAEAIVVLGGGAYRDAPEFGGADNVRPLTLERLRYAAHLQRLTGLPLAVTGGTPPNMATAEATLMQRALSEDFGVAVPWVETASRTTAENASLSRRVWPFHTVILVTHALHMPRAVRVFEQAGFTVIPAPISFFRAAHMTYVLEDFLPSQQGLNVSHYVCYEALGRLWYRWNYG